MNQVFNVVFIMEFAIKVAAKGLFIHPHAYMRDTWNLLDMSVVLISVTELFTMNSQSKMGLKALRTLRVLRPLRSLNAFPAMKKLVRSLGNSISSLLYAEFFLAFVFLIFGIFGIKQFSGKFYNRCRIGIEPESGFWPHLHDNHLCHIGGTDCPASTTCAQPSLHNIKWEKAHSINSPLINYGVTTFDNLPSACITIFQMITLEGWVDIMYLMMESSPVLMSICFSIFLVIFCAFFLLNLILAILSQSIEEVGMVDDPELIEKTNYIVKSLNRARM